MGVCVSLLPSCIGCPVRTMPVSVLSGGPLHGSSFKPSLQTDPPPTSSLRVDPPTPVLLVSGDWAVCVGSPDPDPTGWDICFRQASCSWLPTVVCSERVL